MRPISYEDCIAALSDILPEETVELIEGYFLAVLHHWQIEDVYNRAYPKHSEDSRAHPFFLADAANEQLNNVQDRLWSRACSSLENWLFNAFLKTEEARKYAPDQEDY